MIDGLVTWREALSAPRDTHGYAATGGVEVAMLYAECVDIMTSEPMPELVHTMYYEATA